MYQYEEIEVLGDGAFGTVIKCKKKSDNKSYAIKKMKKVYNDFQSCLKLKEIKSLRKIKHKNIIRLYQVFREDGILHLVFELCQNSLYKTIRDYPGQIPEPQIRYVVKELLTGLSEIHKNGYFHRDIKPENLLWNNNNIKIADFGLAKSVKSRPPYTEYVATRWYRAPEILLRHQFYGPPVDIWAVGCIMAELFTRSPLFQGNSEADQIFKICSVLGTLNNDIWQDGVKLAEKLEIKLPQFAPTPLQKLIPNASTEAIDLLTKIFKYDPSERLTANQALEHSWFDYRTEVLPNNSLFSGKSDVKNRHLANQNKLTESQSVEVTNFEVKDINAKKRTIMISDDDDNSDNSTEGSGSNDIFDF